MCVTGVRRKKKQLKMDKSVLSATKKKITTLFNVVESKASTEFDQALVKKIRDCLDEYHSVLLLSLDEKDVVFDATNEYAVKATALKQYISDGNVSKGVLKLLNPLPFNGSLLAYPTWSTTTLKLLQNSNLPNDQKLLALKNALTGSALKLVGNAASWESALERLATKFTDKKVVVEYCSSTMKSAKSDWSSISSAGDCLILIEDTICLFQSVKTTSDEQDSLKDQILKKLPATFRDDFVKNNEESASLDTLAKFIRDNIKKMVKIAEFHQKPSVQPTCTRPSKKLSKCQLCSGSHHTFRCDVGTPSSRRALVAKQNSCMLCLGKHATKICKSSFRCKKCKAPHATMLCELNVVDEVIQDEILNC